MADKSVEKISVKEFVDKYSSFPSTQARDKICSDSIIRTYVPVFEKYIALLTGFNNTNRDAKGELNINSFLSYLVYTMITISLYTNLDISKSVEEGETNLSFESYDLLKESGALERLLFLIGEKELKEIERINSMIINDAKESELNLHAMFEKDINKYLSQIQKEENDWYL